MNAPTSEHTQSRLVRVLREGVSVIQMVFFKELKEVMQNQYPDEPPGTLAMLTGAITNELFGATNPEAKFIKFRQQHRGIIEQELLGLAENLPHLRRYITDALRVQTLCDHQEGLTSDETLLTAEKLGILLRERDVPLPSTFMTTVRELGMKHKLIIAPVQITAEEDQSLIH